MRSFIAQKVDVIAFSPVVETRLGDRAARSQDGEDSGHPDRPRDRREGRLAVRHASSGSDFVEEGRKAGRWLVDKYKGTTAT